MANREIERYKTREYTTSEGVTVIEEHLKIPLRKEIPGKELDAIHKCEFDLVTFERAGFQPVFWVRESKWNECEDRHLKRCIDGAMYGELNDKRRDLTPEDVTLYVERNNGSVNQVPYFSLPMGEGKCDRDNERRASMQAIDEACKVNFGCKENLAAQHLHEQDISKETLFDKQQGAKVSEAQLWKKMEALNQEAIVEPEQQTQKLEQERSKKR